MPETIDKTIQLPKVFQFLSEKSRYKAAYGGRGSGKSHSFATALILRAAERGTRVLCCREIQKSIKDSSKRLLDDKIDQMGLRWFFKSTETEIKGDNGSLFLFAGLKTNPEAIKSMEGVDIAWVEEADRVSQRSLDLLIPTIRKEGSEIWFTWNPNFEFDAVDMLFRGKNVPPDSIVKQVNYDQNPFFPDVLKQEMEFDQVSDPAKYLHVWLGGYRQLEKGAYYAKQITDAVSQGRITHVAHDPNLQVSCVFDLGMADLTTIWFFQTVGAEIHIIDYYESQYTSIAEDAVMIRSKGYNIRTAWLPHDGKAKQKGTGKSTEEVLQGLGFDVQIVPNISVMAGIDTVRSIFPRLWFDSEKCNLGLKALKHYHEKVDEDLKIGRGPEHDWSSHAADAMRYLSIVVGLEGQTIAKALEAMRGYTSFGEPTAQVINGELHLPKNYFLPKNNLTL